MFDFELVVAWDLQHLLALLAHDPDARIVAGATDFIPFVNVGKWRPRLAIDITGVARIAWLSARGRLGGDWLIGHAQRIVWFGASATEGRSTGRSSSVGG